MAESWYQCLAMRQGGPLEVHQTKPHIPGDDEILVKIKAVALNPIEWKQIDFGIDIPKWPCVLGNDGSGTVVAVGKSVVGFNTGDSVLANFSSGQDRSAAFQSHAVVNAVKVAKKPTSMSFEDASTLPVSYVTATGAIYQGLNIPLPYLEGGKEEGFKPSSILVCGVTQSTDLCDRVQTAPSHSQGPWSGPSVRPLLPDPCRGAQKGIVQWRGCGCDLRCGQRGRGQPVFV
jgi:NADPH:quinone reductase-like Zn-dependent oxidoreductase